MPVMPPTTSFRLSRCCTLIVEQTSMPASSSSSTSCQRLGWREPGALVCASSSTRISAGLRCERRVEIELLERAVAVARLPCAAGAPGPRAGPRSRCGRASRPRRSTTSTPCARSARAARQHRVGLADAGRGAEEDLQLAAPRPAPPRAFGRGQQLHRDRDVVGRHLCHGRSLRLACTRVEGEVQLQHVDPRLAEDAEQPVAPCAARSVLTPCPAATPRALATRVDLIVRRGDADVRVEAAGRGGDQIDRHRRGYCPGRRPSSASMRALTASCSAGLSGPRFEPLEAPAL